VFLFLLDTSLIILFIITLMNALCPTSDSPSLRLAILLLAAGQGSRLGSHPKSLLKKSSQSLLKRFCDSAQALHAIELVVVTGFHAQAIEAHLQEFANELAIPIKVLRNPLPEKGQSSSIRLALESLKSEYDVLLLALSDQPEIGSVEIEALITEFQTKDAEQEIVLPMVNGQRGNPVLFSKKSIEAILRIPDMVCRPYMDNHPEKVRLFSTHHQAYLEDVDTLEDMQRLGITK